jgi:uncharacterized protein YggE
MKRVSLLILTVLFYFLGNAQYKNFIDQPYIEVNGNADTMVTPNEIYIRIQLSEKDTKDKVSIEELEQKMVTGLKELGLNPEKDLTTADIASNFKYYLLKSKDIIKTKTYMLKVKDAVTATHVFMKLEDLGISNTSVDRAEYSDMENLKNIMRAKAIENAKARAVALTKPINQTVGTAIHITDIENFPQPFLEGKVAGIQIRGNASMQDNAVELPKIDFEKIKVTANVNATFILK